MGCPDVLTAVFVETNLGTRLTVPAYPDITAEDFKREVERMHLNCFPELGNIMVNAVMVKQNLHCYHLSGSLPLKYAFLGSDAWFLQTRVNRVESLKNKDTGVHNLNSAANVIADSVGLGGFVLPSYEKKITKCERKKVNGLIYPYLKASKLKTFAISCCPKMMKRKNVKRKRKTGNPKHSPTEKQDTTVATEVIPETISERTEPASVSGIIRKYFSDYDEVASSPQCFSTLVHYGRKKQPIRSTPCEYSNALPEKIAPVTGHIVSQDVWLEKPRSEHKKPEVGNRLLLASNSLGLAPSNRRSIVSLCRYNGGESQLHKFTATVRNLVFDITDKGG